MTSNWEDRLAEIEAERENSENVGVEAGDVYEREVPDLKGGTYTETAEIQKAAEPGKPVSLDHSGDNMYTLAEDGETLKKHKHGLLKNDLLDTGWEPVEEEEPSPIPCVDCGKASAESPCPRCGRFKW